MFSWLLGHRPAGVVEDQHVVTTTGDEVGWDALLDVESNLLILTGQNGMSLLEKTLLELCAHGRAMYWFTKGYEPDQRAATSEVDFRKSGRYDADHLDQFILHHKCTIETFDIPPTILILDDTIDLAESYWLQLLRTAQGMHLTVILLTKDLTKLRAALIKQFHHFVMCRATMTRRERRVCFEQLVRKAKMPSTITISSLEKNTSARRFRKGRHATVIARSEGSVLRIPIIATTT